MASFTAYFDASGHRDSGSVLFVSGFVSSNEKWLRFEAEWAALLHRYGIAPPFHMRQFAPAVGQYVTWKDDKARRERFLRAAIATIKRRTRKSFSSGVLLSDLRAVQQEYEVSESMRHPYALCGLTVIARVGEWVRRRNIVGSLTLAFEDGDDGKGRLINVLERMKPRKNVPIRFLSKTECRAFDAADFLAWEHNRLARDATSGLRTRRASLLALIRHVPHDGSWGMHTRASLIAHCEQHGLPKRSGH